MQRTTKPLTYIEVSGGTVTPGSILTYTGGGSVIMNAVPTKLLLDPSGAITIDSMVTAYNSLVWGLYQSGMIITEPRVWFGSAGETGILLSHVNAPVAIPYAPYSGASGAYSYISMNDALTALNRGLDPSGAQFRYTGGRVSLIVQDGTTIRFEEDLNAAYGPPSAYGSTRRMLNRLFLRDISGYIGVDLSGPRMIQGEPIAAPTYGVFPEPAPASNIVVSNVRSYSFDITWDDSATPVVGYYVHVAGSGANHLFFTRLTTLSLGVSQGIFNNDTYNITIIAMTPYEVSTSSNASTQFPYFYVPLTFTLSSTPNYYKYIDVFWRPAYDNYSMSIQVNNDPPSIMLANIGYINFQKSQPGIYAITANLIDDNGNTENSQSITVELFDIPQPNISLNGTTANSVTLTHTLITPPERQGTIADIEIKYVKNGNTVTFIRPYNDTTITINSLTALTDYDFEIRYILYDGIEKGNPTQIAATTSLPLFNLTLGPVTATRITVTWPISTPNYIVTFTAPTASFDVDAALGTYTFKLLQPTTNYTVTAYLKKNGVQSADSSVNTTTPVLPTVFGPVNDGKPLGSRYEIVVLNLSPGNLGSQFGVTIPDDSIYTNYKFNNISFPSMPLPSGVTIGTMRNSTVNAYAKIYIYSNSSRNQIITESNTIEIIGSSVSDTNTPYLFTFPVVITLIKDMCIIPTILTTSGEIRISYYTYSNGDPLTGLVDTPGNTNLISTNSVMLFNFVWQ